MLKFNSRLEKRTRPLVIPEENMSQDSNDDLVGWRSSTEFQSASAGPPVSKVKAAAKKGNKFQQRKKYLQTIPSRLGFQLTQRPKIHHRKVVSSVSSKQLDLKVAVLKVERNPQDQNYKFGGFPLRYVYCRRPIKRKGLVSRYQSLDCERK